MNVRRAISVLTVAILLSAGSCSNSSNTDLPGGSDQDVQASRSAPRMLFHNPAGELDVGLMAPARLAFTASAFYVADPMAKVIVAFDRVGGSLDPTVYPLDEAPVGIATDGVNFYVSLLGGHDSDSTVKIYDAAFAEIGELAAGVVDFVHPTDIAIDGLGRIHVVDSGADVVYVFDDAGVLLFTIGERGSGPGQFKYPSSIAIDTANDQIVVADQDNHRVQVFDNTGDFAFGFGYRVKYIGNGMTAETWMGRLAGVAVDDGGFIYLIDGLMGTVQIYDQTGGILGEVLGHEAEFGGLVNPADIAIDPLAELVLVVNTGAGKVQIYEEEPAGDLRNVISTSFLGGNPESGAMVRGWDEPHMQEDLSCARCHDFDDQPDGHLGQAAGQANLCFSCHTSSGQAVEHMFLADGSASHPWGVDAVDADHGSTGPPEGSPMADHLDNGDIKCTTCHDQHTEEAAEPFLRAPIGAGILCGQCHIQKDQWDQAGHSDADSRAFDYPTGPGREACARCHSGLGYIDFTNGVPEEDRRTDKQVHACFVCHGPHGVSNDELLRTYDEITLPGDHQVTAAGASATCMACHNGRYTPGGSHNTPHYALGGVMLVGINGAEYDAALTNSAHTAAANCTVCHMADTPGEGEPGAGKVGGHSVNMTVHDEADEFFGFENYANSCGTCHVVGLTEFNRTAGGDYDGDATVEGVQDEVQGLLDLVFTAVTDAGAIFLGNYPYWNFDGVVDDPPGYLQIVKDAVWNSEYVDNDASLGVHNTKYAVGLLQVSYNKVTGVDVPGAVLSYLPNARRGGLLYDKWWKVNGAAQPTGDHPLYPEIGQKSGNTTFRCKECHGWDYKGAAGAYASGSHFTGIPGILGTSLTAEQLFDILKNPDGDGTGGTTVNGHDFGTFGMSDGDINDVVQFIQDELIDTGLYIDFGSKAFLGDPFAGQALYDGVTEPLANCAICHGSDGRSIDFGDGDYLGALADGNPWEALHKVRFGQPAKTMCSYVKLSLTDGQASDVGAYCQTLPTE